MEVRNLFRVCLDFRFVATLNRFVDPDADFRFGMTPGCFNQRWTMLRKKSIKFARGALADGKVFIVEALDDDRKRL